MSNLLPTTQGINSIIPKNKIVFKEESENMKNKIIELYVQTAMLKYKLEELNGRHTRRAQKKQFIWFIIITELGNY